MSTFVPVKKWTAIALFSSLVLFLLPMVSRACGSGTGGKMSCCQKDNKQPVSPDSQKGAIHFSQQTIQPACSGACHHASCHCLASNTTPAISRSSALIFDLPDYGEGIKPHPSPDAISSGFFSIWRPPKLS